MKMMCPKSSLVVTLAGGILVLMFLSSASPATAVVYEDALDVEGGDAAVYGAFLDSFNTNVKQTAARSIKDHPVLKAQDHQNPPVDWLHVTLKAEKTGDRVTLAIRGDNLYVIGFRNKHGEWFTFLKEKHLIPASTELTFTGSYGQLFDEKAGGWKKLASLPVNRAHGVAHLRTMANFRPAGVAAGTDATLKAPLAFFILSVSEAERFTPIRSAVAAAWMDKAPHLLPEQSVVQFVVKWRDFSCALLCWNRAGETPAAWNNNKEAKQMMAIKEFNVHSAQDALAKAMPVLHVAGKCSCGKF